MIHLCLLLLLHFQLMGQEQWKLVKEKEVLGFYLQYGMFMPGGFYQIEIPRTGGTALGAETPANFWALLAGATVTF